MSEAARPYARAPVGPAMSVRGIVSLLFELYLKKA